MKVGTKSVLFGAHSLLIHPWFVALAWWKLFGFPIDPRLWLAFWVHDLGYWKAPNMDGTEGEMHVFFGARIMGVFDADVYNVWFGWKHERFARLVDRLFGKGAPNWYDVDHPKGRRTWYCFSFYHSRFMAKRYGTPHSMLCVADKYACALEPAWLYLPRVILSGEVKEYMAHRTTRSKYSGEPITEAERVELEKNTIRGWHRGMTDYTRRWVQAHRNGQQDDWTPKAS